MDQSVAIQESLEEGATCLTVSFASAGVWGTGGTVLPGASAPVRSPGAPVCPQFLDSALQAVQGVLATGDSVESRLLGLVETCGEHAWVLGCVRDTGRAAGLGREKPRALWILQAMETTRKLFCITKTFYWPGVQ